MKSEQAFLIAADHVGRAASVAVLTRKTDDTLHRSPLTDIARRCIYHLTFDDESSYG